VSTRWGRTNTVRKPDGKPKGETTRWGNQTAHTVGRDVLVGCYLADEFGCHLRKAFCGGKPVTVQTQPSGAWRMGNGRNFGGPKKEGPMPCPKLLNGPKIIWSGKWRELQACFQLKTKTLIVAVLEAELLRGENA